MTALLWACMNGHEQCALELIKAGAAVDAVENKQWTALMFAAQGGHEQCALELIKAGATVDAQNNQGYTSLMLACFGNHEQCARELLKAGADRTKEVPGYAGLNAYKLAERAGHTVICDLLNMCYSS